MLNRLISLRYSVIDLIAVAICTLDIYLGHWLHCIAIMFVAGMIRITVHEIEQIEQDIADIAWH